MKRVGITGGIGCGKSTVVLEFRRLGVPCFVADDVARTYYDDKAFCAEIASAFGQEVLDAEGFVVRRKLAAKVFNDATALERLNALIHPRVMEDFDRWCKQCAKQGAPYVLLESAILFEHGLDRYVDTTICVYLEHDERVSRLLERDHVSVAEIEARMSRQQPAEQTLMMSDYVILNYEGNPRLRQVLWTHRLLMGNDSSTPSTGSGTN